MPPLQLLSAAMWQLVKQKDVMNYDKLQEFVVMVTEVVPGLINQTQRTQLILGLRARVSRACLTHHMFIKCSLKSFLQQNFFPIFQLILELCKGSVRGSVNSQVVQSYLEKLPLTTASTDVSALKRDISFIKQHLNDSFCFRGSVQRCRGENNRVNFHCTCAEPAERSAGERIFLPGQKDFLTIRFRRLHLT